MSGYSSSIILFYVTFSYSSTEIKESQSENSIIIQIEVKSKVNVNDFAKLKLFLKIIRLS